MRNKSYVATLAIFVLLPLGGLIFVTGPRPSDGSIAALPASVKSFATRKASAVKLYGKLPLRFEANRGQTDPRVKFLSRGPGYTLFLTAGEAVLSLSAPQPRTDAAAPDLLASEAKEAARLAVVRLKLVGANPTRVEGLGELPGKSNYFIGNDPKKWRTNVPAYSKVKYRGVYPGVDLVYYGNQQKLEHDFVVAPGADPRAIHLQFEGAEKLSFDALGDLVLSIKGGELRLVKAVVYQEARGVRQEVAGAYRLEGQNEVSFALGPYDTSRPLVIDPVLFYSTYLGGSGYEQLNTGGGIAVDAAGNAHIIGQTASPDFPTTSGAFQTTFGGGNFDAFVTKLNPTGSALYSTFLGGNGQDTGNSIAIDLVGNAYVTGTTSSSNFPTTPGAFQTTFVGGGILSIDGFVTKLNPTGSALVYSTFLGGNDQDGGASIAIDSAGNAYVGGSTSSSNFPTANPIQAANAGGPADGFVAKLNSTGSVLLYSTYLGGNDFDAVFGIVVDAIGSAYVTGPTRSSNFPTTVGAFQTSFGGGLEDAFVTKLNPSGSAFVYSTFLGGNNHDEGFAIAADPDGNAYVTGITISTNFPTTSGVLQTAFGGGDGDAFVTKLNPLGTGLVYSTFLGGNGFDRAFGIAVDAPFNAYVTGHTGSTNFPTVSPVQAALNGPADAFVTKVNPTGTGLIYSTYLGGSGGDAGLGIAIDALPNPNAYVAGNTNSTNFPTTTGAFQATFGGGGVDAFVAKLVINQPPVANPGANQTVEAGAGGTNVTMDGSGSSDPNAGDTLSFEWFDSNGNVVGTGPVLNLTLPIGTHTFTLKVTDGSGATSTSPVTIIVQDTAPPVLGLPGNMTVEATSAAGAVVNYTATANDVVDGVVAVNCTPASGSTFALGTTLVNCSASDAHGNTANGNFSVTVQDTTPPTIDPHVDITAEATSAAGAVVNYSSPATHDAVDGDGVASCAPASGNQFALGNTTVTCNAADAHGNMAAPAMFVVHVVDTTPPALTLSTNSITLILPTATATGATVDLSGIASATDAVDAGVAITHNAPPGSFFPIGATVVTFTATDDAGNASTAQLTVRVIYNFIGFLMPIRNDGSSIFRAGRLILIRFQLTAADGTFITNAVATLQVFKITDAILGTVEEITPDAAGNSNTGNLFRFDADSNQYLYNLDTRGFSVGTYLLRVTLNDGTVHEVIVSVST